MDDAFGSRRPHIVVYKFLYAAMCGFLRQTLSRSSLKPCSVSPRCADEVEFLAAGVAEAGSAIRGHSQVGAALVRR